MGLKVAPPLEGTTSKPGENGRPCERASLVEATRRSTSAVAGEPWGTENEENNAKADAQMIFITAVDSRRFTHTQLHMRWEIKLPPLMLAQHRGSRAVDSGF